MELLPSLPSKEGKWSIDSLPVEIWIKIFEIGISQENRSNRFVIKDISSLLVTCKLFNKLWTEDTLWSLLVTLDFPQFATDAGSKPYSSAKKMLYKYCFARHCKIKYVHYNFQLKMVETDIRLLAERIERLDNRIKSRTEDLESYRKLLQPELDKGKGSHISLITEITESIDELTTAQEEDLAKFKKREAAMSFLVGSKEACEKYIKCFQFSLGGLCAGPNSIEINDLWLPDDKIEDTEDYMNSDIYVDVDVDVDTTDYEDNDEDEDEFIIVDPDEV